MHLTKPGLLNQIISVQFQRFKRIQSFGANQEVCMHVWTSVTRIPLSPDPKSTVILPSWVLYCLHACRQNLARLKTQPYLHLPYTFRKELSSPSLFHIQYLSWVASYSSRMYPLPPGDPPPLYTSSPLTQTIIDYRYVVPGCFAKAIYCYLSPSVILWPKV